MILWQSEITYNNECKDNIEKRYPTGADSVAKHCFPETKLVPLKLLKNIVDENLKIKSLPSKFNWNENHDN